MTSAGLVTRRPDADRGARHSKTRPRPRSRRCKACQGITSVALPDRRTARQPGYDDIIAIPNVRNRQQRDARARCTARRRRLRTSPASSVSPATAAIQQDYSHAVFGQFPLMFALIAFATFILLVRAFRSLLLAIKAVLLNLVSLAATFGLITWFWQQGHGSHGVVQHPGNRRVDVLDPADDLRVPVRPVDGLRGLHPEPHARGVRRHRLDQRGGHRRHRSHRPSCHQCGADSVHGASRRWRRRRTPTSRCSQPRSAPASCSTPRSCAPCWCPRWCRCSVATTGGCRRGWRSRCGSRRRHCHRAPRWPRRRPSRSPSALT